MVNTNRLSTAFTAASGSRAGTGVASGGGGGGTGTGTGDNRGDRSNTASANNNKKDLWSSMLDSVASGRRLPARQMLVFGGSATSQQEFLASLGGRAERRDEEQQEKSVDRLALGYTYYDVLEEEQHEDSAVARVSVYLLSQPARPLGDLLRPLLTPATIPHTLIVVLLDWAEPWRWLRQLRAWILLLRTVLLSLSPESKEVMEEAMVRWRLRGRAGGSVRLDGTSTNTTTGAATTNTSNTTNTTTSTIPNTEDPTTISEVDEALPPGPGEWEDALGLPLCVVCQNAEKTDILEKTHGWKDDEFDLVLQYLRTVLLKHGASLLYTTPHVPSPLPHLVHACLGVSSLLLPRASLQPEVIKRVEVLVPSNWDSWTKILVVREGFDVERVSQGWSSDLGGDAEEDEQSDDNSDVFEDAPDTAPTQSAVALYERAIRNPGLEEETEIENENENDGLDVATQDHQTFLEQQLPVLNELREKDEKRREKEAREAAAATGGGGSSSPAGRRRAAAAAATSTSATSSSQLPYDDENPADFINNQIGPVQFNMGGIQVDADDMLERIKNRHYSPEPEAKPKQDDTRKINTEEMSAFFSGLMNRPSQTGKT